jgi:hypothetical protein
MVRQGPPEAVSTIFSTAAYGSAPPPRASSAWKMALCSESTGSNVAPAAPRGGKHDVPRADEAFLVGERQDATAGQGSKRRRQARRAHDRRHGPVHRPGCGSDDGVRAGGGLDARAGQGVAQRAVAGGVGDDGQPGVQLSRLGRKASDVAIGDQRLDLERTGGGVVQESDSAAADRACAPEDGEGADHGWRPGGGTSPCT